MNLTPFYLYLLSLNDEQKGEILSDQLYTNVVVGDYENAATMSVVMDKSNASIVTDVVTKLLDNNVNNIVEFAYKLWCCGGKELITKHFPVQFRLIFNDNYLKIINKRYGMALKLSLTIVEGDRQAWGDAKDNSTNRVSWYTIPIWEGNRVYFKFVNVNHNQFLKLAINDNVGGDRTAWGANDARTERHMWYLRTVKYEGELLFYIYNRQYNEPLKLHSEADSAGDRVLLGHQGYVDNPGNYGWYITPF